MLPGILKRQPPSRTLTALVVHRTDFADRPLLRHAFESELLCLWYRGFPRVCDERPVACELPAQPAARDITPDVWRAYNLARWRLMLYVSGVRQRPLHLRLARTGMELARAAMALRNAIVAANIGLAHDMASRFVPASTSREDLVAEALTRLIHAAERFDFARGVRFSSYACTAILNHLYRWSKKQQRGAAVCDASSSEDSHEPAAPEDRPVEVAGVDVEELKRAMAAACTARERRVLRLRYGLDGGEARLLRQVAEMMGVTKQRVEQLEARALAKIRKAFGNGPVVTESRARQ